MKPLGLLFAALAALGSAGCTKVDTFNCLQSAECMNGGVAGVCEPGNLCSFPDPNCPSGKSFGEYAGDQANLCVDGPGTSSVSDTATTSSGSATGSGTSDPTVDPTTTTMTSEVTAATDPGTTTGPACAPLGDSCTNTPCCGGPCTTCEGGTCTALPAEMGPTVCGSVCFACSPAGECSVVPPDQTCPIDCDDIVLDSQVSGDVTLCRGYGAMPLMGTCNDVGACTVSDPVAAGCLADAPTVIAECDTACVLDPGLCVPGAVGLSKADLCALDAPTPACKTTCTPDNLSSDEASCDAAGGCQHTIKSCGLFTCNVDTGLCRTKCMNDSDCVSGNCKGSQCL